MSAAELRAVEGFDEPGPRNASEILPADLIKGDHFRVHDGVGWNDGLHEFTVETEFGSFDVWGEPMLRVRLAEVDAEAMGRSALSAVGALANTFAHPIRTIAGFRRVSGGCISGPSTALN
jgi:hypothetical protein